MFGRHKRDKERTDQGYQDAANAWEKSVMDKKELEAIIPAVESVVKGHLKLQLENHFAERIALAYRGEDS